ncbi:Z1 domain-containing protein [Corynebacterium bovis]|uniref:Z1 domain-containing protein n=1 Tax=Corynebacterium bovis TaxID=36808 RepID=UPI00244C81CE|nr:Z1 domain-containing protein [Corynebacterium bovis]MDH2456636.1 Z1 domain-containing protein [Corynebacterium bovis]
MPEGYFGTEQVFGRDALPSEDPDEISDDVHDIIREIPEDELNEVRPPSRNINAWNPAVPESLSQAIRWFLLATATRRLRGDAGKHSSMLIHASSRTDAHEALASEVDAEIRSVREGIRTGRLRDDLRTQWESETSLNPLNPDYGEPLSFDQVWAGLPDVAGDLETIIDNGTSEERLDYEAKIRTVIAVGGNTLPHYPLSDSRGRTGEASRHSADYRQPNPLRFANISLSPLSATVLHGNFPFPVSRPKFKPAQCVYLS